MKTIVEALQDLYVALGGKKSDVSALALNPDVIEQIAALVNGGALNELPAVTIEDAGDVLTVDETGKWGVAAPGGGGGLTLYGPYMVVNQSATVGTSSTEIYVDTVDINDDTKMYIPPDDGDYETFSTGRFTKPAGIEVLEVYNLYRRNGSSPESAYFRVYAKAESSTNISAGDLYFEFLSTRPFRLQE